MPKKRAVWGLDLGNCALKALKLTSNDSGGIDVLAYDFIEHSKILSQPDADPNELISKTIEKFLSKNDITDTQIVIGVPGQHTLSRFSKLPPVDPKKIPDIVQFEANQQIPFDMDEVVWDYQTFMEEDSPEIEVGIFAMKRDLIHQHLAHYSDAGIEPVLVQAAPLALYDSMCFDEQCSDETTVIVDIGAENTDLIITDKVRIWTRTIPIGGNKFTDALIEGFKLSFSKAENLKRQAATSKYARQIFQAMRPIFADIVGEIQRSIGFYTSTHRDAKIDRLVGMGNAFKLPGLQKYLQQNLGMDVVRPTEFNKLKLSTSSEQFNEEILSFGVAYGLALEGISKGSITSNLLPPEIARSITWRKKKPWFAGAAASLLVASMMVWFRFSQDMGSLEANRGNQPSPMAYQAAVSTFNSGISENSPPREYAQNAVEMMKTIKAEYDKAAALGKVEIDENDAVLQVLQYRDVVMKYLDTIHRSLPTLQEPLNQVSDGFAFISAILADPDKLARSNRRQIVIDSLSSNYVEDVYTEDYRDPDAGEDDRELFDYFNDKEAIDGFVITLECHTPHGDRVKFANEYVTALQQNGRIKGMGLYLDGIRILPAKKGSSARPTNTPATPAATRTTGLGAGPGSPKPTPASAQPNKDLDPLTLEDRSADWNFIVKMVVVLQELPEKETPGSPGNAKGAAKKPGGASAPPVAPPSTPPSDGRDDR